MNVYMTITALIVSTAATFSFLRWASLQSEMMAAKSHAERVLEDTINKYADVYAKIDRLSAKIDSMSVMQGFKNK